jgi:hypothetical protein
MPKAKREPAAGAHGGSEPGRPEVGTTAADGDNPKCRSPPNPTTLSFSLNPLVDRWISRKKNCTDAPDAYSSSAYRADVSLYLG